MVLVWAPEVVVLLVRWVLVSSKCFNWFYVKIHVKALLVSDITLFDGMSIMGYSKVLTKDQNPS